MIILLDANISWRLTKTLDSYFDEVLHVDSIGLPLPPKDTEIWDFAKKNHSIIVTNDDDFYKLALLKGFPPKIVILRTGNQSTNFISELIIKHKNDIENLYNSDECGILEII